MLMCNYTKNFYIKKVLGFFGQKYFSYLGSDYFNNINALPTVKVEKAVGGSGRNTVHTSHLHTNQ